MRPLSPELPPHVAEIIRQLPPDLKHSVRQALRALSTDPEAGEPLKRELEGLWRYRVRRFRIVYRVDRGRGALQVLAVGHRQTVYEEVANREQRRRTGETLARRPTKRRK